MGANDCNLPYIAEVTGISAKTLSSWANNRGKLSALDRPRVRRVKLFNWVEVRPVLVAEVMRAKASGEDLEHFPVRVWPK